MYEPVLWNRIRIRIGSGSRRAKMTHKNIEKLINFEASPVAWTSFMEA
jgi:hypothetical protein